MLVKHVMKSPVVTVDQNRSMREAAEVVNEAEIGSVVICADGKAIGILTERDILKFIGRGGDAGKTRVSEIISKPLIVVSPGTKLEERLSS